jgi:hypothetical protein
MASDSSPFLLRFWWLPLALLAVATAIAAWVYRERPLGLQSLPASVLPSTASVESALGEPPARQVDYRARVTIEGQGQRSESIVRHVAEHLGDGWIRRSDHWYDEGASTSTYQERYLLHRNLLQVYQKRRVMAPFVHDLLAEYGWLADTTRAQSVVTAGAFPREEGSSISVRQNRVAATDKRNLVPNEMPYERTFECRRDGVVEGSTLGAALSGPLVRVSCRSMRSHVPGEAINVYLWRSQDVPARSCAATHTTRWNRNANTANRDALHHAMKPHQSSRPSTRGLRQHIPHRHEVLPNPSFHTEALRLASPAFASG